MKTALITGGAGFFGTLMKHHLLEEGWTVVSIDLERDEDSHPNLTSIQGDIRDQRLLEDIFKANQFDVVFHFAAILAHAVKDKNFLWESNVDGTRNVVEAAVKFKVPKLIYTSSNCLWGENFGRPIKEEDTPSPVEIYGRSKWEGEKILDEFQDSLSIITFRCPTIIEEGRLGLLTILFEFIDEGRKVWVVGGGKNVYQFIYARDLIAACMAALDYDQSATFNIGSDDVKSFREVYDFVIQKANTKARVANLPRWLIIPCMKIAYALKLSPLGPYQYKMIAEDFLFDTSKIKRELSWSPTLKNEDMLLRAYEYYQRNRKDIENRQGVSAHKQSAKMGIIRLLKWFS